MVELCEIFSFVVGEFNYNLKGHGVFFWGLHTGKTLHEFLKIVFFSVQSFMKMKISLLWIYVSLIKERCRKAFDNLRKISVISCNFVLNNNLHS